MKPISQLFLFSDEFQPNIDSWFSGNLILELDAETHEFNVDTEKEWLCMTELVFGLHGNYKKLTIVTNYNELGLTMACTSGFFNCICKLHDKNDYIAVKNLHHAVSIQNSNHIRLTKLRNKTTYSLNYSKLVKSNSLIASVESFQSAYDDLIIKSNLVTDEFRKYFDLTFRVF